MHVKEILAHKGPAVITIAPGETVARVAQLLAEHRIGALVVTRDGLRIEGIVSERDVVKALNAFGADVLNIAVREIMTADVHTCVPADEVRSLARTMTEKRFRHMPVVVDGALSGIVTIGDIVKGRVDELETEHEQLMDYISSAG
jgi:CBS domain-containing protein